MGSQTVSEAHARLVADDSIQFTLPHFTPPKPPAWLEPLLRAIEALGPYMIYIFWGVVIAGGAIILLLTVRELRGVAWRLPWQRGQEHEGEADWRPEQGLALVLLSEADALATRGDYDGAVHLLLRRSVADIAARLPDFLRPSLTARDIASAPAVPAPARDAFGELARIVETSLFAQRPVGEPGWRSARGAYERFAFKDAWR